LSAEWDGPSSDEPAGNAEEEAVGVGATSDSQEVNPAAIAETVEEVRFYLSNGMSEEARTAYAKLRQLRAEPALLAELRQEIESGTAKAQPATASAMEEISVEPVDAIDPVELPVAPAAEVASVGEVASAPAKSGALDAFVNDLESSLGDEFLPQATAHEAVSAEPQPHAALATAHQPPAKLNEFVSDLEASLGDSFLAEAPVAQVETKQEVRTVAEKAAKPESVAAKSEPTYIPPVQVPVAKAAAAAQTGSVAEASSAPATFTYHPTPARPLAPQTPAPTPATFDSAAGVDLADMFGELKQELEEDSAKMGLLDEAIGELQKVCQSVERGHPFPNIMQTYTWLSQCFLDKGIPEAAIRWYEKALKLSTIDADTRTALHYELATSYETAGDKASALTHFMEVYGSNIDYRDVAERIKTLKS
jgi:tetratricopeptide (TPR) repeat protein